VISLGCLDLVTLRVVHVFFPLGGVEVGRVCHVAKHALLERNEDGRVTESVVASARKGDHLLDLELAVDNLGHFSDLSSARECHGSHRRTQRCESLLNSEHADVGQNVVSVSAGLGHAGDANTEVDIDVSDPVHNWLQNEGGDEISNCSLLVVRLILLALGSHNFFSDCLCKLDEGHLVTVKNSDGHEVSATLDIYERGHANLLRVSEIAESHAADVSAHLVHAPRDGVSHNVRNGDLNFRLSFVDGLNVCQSLLHIDIFNNKTCRV